MDTPATLTTIDLVINDESVINDRGYSVLNRGLDSARFLLNPICLYMHDMERPIGMCKAMHVEGSKLIGTFEFDAGAPLACEVHRKLTAGFIKGTSAGFFIRHMEFSPDRDVVDEWELVEVSVVTIPSNRGAVKLYGEDFRPLNAEEATAHIQSLKSNINNIDNMTSTTTTQQQNKNSAPQVAQNLMLSKEAYEALGISQSSTVEELSKAITTLAEQNRKLQETIDLAR